MSVGGQRHQSAAASHHALRRVEIFRLVLKENWDQQTHKHVCEVQVILGCFRKVIENPASGLNWEGVGTAKPAQGRELTNDGLAAILQQKTELSDTEWEKCGIHDLRYDDFIKVGDAYYKPTDSRYEALRDLTGT